MDLRPTPTDEPGLLTPLIIALLYPITFLLLALPNILCDDLLTDGWCIIGYTLDSLSPLFNSSSYLFIDIRCFYDDLLLALLGLPFMLIWLWLCDLVFTLWLCNDDDPPAFFSLIYSISALSFLFCCYIKFLVIYIMICFLLSRGTLYTLAKRVFLSTIVILSPWFFSSIFEMIA